MEMPSSKKLREELGRISSELGLDRPTIEAYTSSQDQFVERVKWVEDFELLCTFIRRSEVDGRYDEPDTYQWLRVEMSEERFAALQRKVEDAGLIAGYTDDSEILRQAVASRHRP